MSVQILAALLLMQFLAPTCGKAVKDGSSAWISASTWEVIADSGHWDHLGSKPADGSLLSVTLTFT